MIEAHPNLQCPPDDAVLWRFMDFTKYAALLQSGCLHFARLTEMQDKFEGALTRPTVEAMRSYFKETVPDKADELIPQFPKFSDYMRGDMLRLLLAQEPARVRGDVEAVPVVKRWDRHPDYLRSY